MLWLFLFPMFLFFPPVLCQYIWELSNCIGCNLLWKLNEQSEVICSTSSIIHLDWLPLMNKMYICTSFFWKINLLNISFENCLCVSDDKVKPGPGLFGLHPNGLFTFGRSPFGLPSHLDHTQLDYLLRLDYRRLEYKDVWTFPHCHLDYIHSDCFWWCNVFQEA